MVQIRKSFIEIQGIWFGLQKLWGLWTYIMYARKYITKNTLLNICIRMGKLDIEHWNSINMNICLCKMVNRKNLFWLPVLCGACQRSEVVYWVCNGYSSIFCHFRCIFVLIGVQFSSVCLFSSVLMSDLVTVVHTLEVHIFMWLEGNISWLKKKLQVKSALFTWHFIQLFQSSFTV